MIIVNRRCSVVSKNFIAVCNSTTNWKIIYHRIKLNCKITLITKKIFPNWRNLSRFIRTDWKISDFKKSGLDKKKEARTLNIDLRNNCADSSSLILFSYAIKQFTDSKSNFQYCACNWMLHCHVLWNNTEKKGVGSLQFAVCIRFHSQNCDSVWCITNVLSYQSWKNFYVDNELM